MSAEACPKGTTKKVKIPKIKYGVPRTGLEKLKQKLMRYWDEYRKIL